MKRKGEGGTCKNQGGGGGGGRGAAFGFGQAGHGVTCDDCDTR